MRTRGHGPFLARRLVSLRCRRRPGSIPGARPPNPTGSIHSAINTFPRLCFTLPLVASVLLAAPPARADVVNDWNARAAELTAAAALPAPAAYRAMALVQTAVFEAVNAVTRAYPGLAPGLEAAPGAGLEAAVAAANRVVLLEVLPTQAQAIEGAFELALAALPADAARRDGLELGERAARHVLARRAGDGADAQADYRPATAPGVYVPTALPVLPQWPGRTPWVLARADQLRPEPPPALDGATWARDFAEIRARGARHGSTRSPEETAIARFWEATQPGIYFAVVQSVARQTGREPTRNARLLAAAAQAMDDALIAVFDAKYHYGFWRPLTAIRNADRDGNDATERDPAWLPLIETPMHPEYPAAHCALAAAVGAVLAAEVGPDPLPRLVSVSPTAPGVTRSWTRIEDFVQEVADARVLDGVHFRNSTRVGSDLGRQVGELVAARWLRPAH